MMLIHKQHFVLSLRQWFRRSLSFGMSYLVIHTISKATIGFKVLIMIKWLSTLQVLRRVLILNVHTILTDYLPCIFNLLRKFSNVSTLNLQPLFFLRFDVFHVVQFLIFEVQRLPQIIYFILFTLLQLNVLNSLLKLLVAIIENSLNCF
jgi:hypothetical protein